jgi:tRNA modification GTPase
MHNTDTIIAEATPKGRGGLAVMRISGPEAKRIGEAIAGRSLLPRQAHFAKFRHDTAIIDEGLALYFQAPHSFTGEDVVELQCHGSPLVVDQLLECALTLGARSARPGEFSERAFLNNKIDLVQAEAIADLIAAGTREAANAALRSLSGEFSQKIEAILQALIQLRVFIEGTLDFPEEEIEFLENHAILQQLEALLQECERLQRETRQGVLLQEGLHLALIGRPNAGKSSLLNAFTQNETAIVSELPGTTRDIIKESINIQGIPLHMVDTAGLRITQDALEQEGIKRTEKALQSADCLIILVDIRERAELDTLLAEYANVMTDKPAIVVFNKVDLVAESAALLAPIAWPDGNTRPALQMSVKNRTDLALLETQILTSLGWDEAQENGHFSARRRHLDALSRTSQALRAGLTLFENSQSVELLAEECRQAQTHLGELTGAFRSDDLLGALFSSFCIGK